MGAVGAPESSKRAPPRQAANLGEQVRRTGSRCSGMMRPEEEWGEGGQVTPGGKETHPRRTSRTTVRRQLSANTALVALKANAK